MWNKVASIVMFLMVIGGCSQESQHKKEGSHLSKMTSLDIHDQEIKQLAEEFISLTLDDKIAAQNAMKSADWQAMLNNTVLVQPEMDKHLLRRRDNTCLRQGVFSGIWDSKIG